MSRAFVSKTTFTEPARARLPLPVIVLLAADLLICTAYLVNFAAGRPFYPLNVLLDLDAEANLPAWYSSTQLFLVALLFGLNSMREYRRRSNICWPLLLLSLAFLAMSLDEIAQIHERLGEESDILLPGGTREETFFHRTGIWMFLLGIPFAIFVGLVGAFLSRRLKNRAPVRLFLAGGMLLVAGAAGVEVLSNIPGDGTFAFAMEVFSEELLEMVGVTLIFWSALSMWDELDEHSAAGLPTVNTRQAQAKKKRTRTAA